MNSKGNKKQAGVHTKAISENDWRLETQELDSLTVEDLVNASPFKCEPEEGEGPRPTLGARVPRWMERELRVIRERTGSPYQTSSDIVLDCIYIGLKILHLRFKSRDWYAEHKMEVLAEDIGFLERTNMRIDKLNNGLEALIRNGYPDRAMDQLRKFISTATDINDDWHRSVVMSKLANLSNVRSLLMKSDPAMMKMVDKAADVKALTSGNSQY